MIGTIAIRGARCHNLHNLTARHLSFNVPGVLTFQMQLLPGGEVRCPGCHGRRQAARRKNAGAGGAGARIKYRKRMIGHVERLWLSIR